MCFNAVTLWGYRMRAFFKATSSKIVALALLVCGFVSHTGTAHASTCDASTALRDSSASTPISLTITGTEVQRTSMDNLWAIVSGTDDEKFRVLGTAIGAAQNWMGSCSYPGIGLGVGSGFDVSTRNVTIWMWQNGVDVGLAREAIYALIGEPLGNAVLTAPSYVLTNESAQLNASGSMPSFGGVTYAWDINNDETFEVSTGTSPTYSVAWGEPGLHTVRVKATRSGGVSNTATADINVLLAPPGDEPGVSILNGMARTSSLDVNVSMVWPAYATFAKVSNDGAFASATTRTISLANSFSWTLEDAGDGVYSTSVYVRFIGPGIDRTRTYSDSIVLDRSTAATTSTITSVTVAPSSSTTDVVVNSTRADSAVGSVSAISVHAQAQRVLRTVSTSGSKVLNPRARVCRITAGHVVALKSGTCRISVLIRGPKGRMVTKIMAFPVISRR